MVANMPGPRVSRAVEMHDSLVANIYADPQKALSLGLEILQLPAGEVPDTIRAFTTLHLGVLLDRKGFTVQGLAFYLEAADMLEKIGLRSRCGYLYIDIGNLYYHQGDHGKAREKYETARKLFEEEENWAGIYTAINNFGLIERSHGNLDSALTRFREALHIARSRLDIPFLTAHSYKYIGDTFHAMGIRDSAIYYYDRILEINITRQNDNLIGRSHEKAASVWLEKGDTLRAVRHLKLAERNYLRETHMFYLSDLYQRTADLYFRIDEADSALIFLDRARNIAEREGMIDHRIRIQRRFINHYGSTAEIRKLMEHQITLNRLLEQRYRSEISTQLRHMDIEKILREYRHTLLTKELELKNARLIRNSAVMAGIFLLALLWLLYSRYRNRQDAHRKILEQKERTHAREMEIEAMKKEHANRELVCKAALIERQNIFMENLKNELLRQGEKNGDEQKRHIQKAVRSIGEFLRTDPSWEQFQTQFVKIFPGFFDRLTSRYPSLSVNDLKICAYHRMGLSTKEIASLTALTVRAIQTSRYRLRKKLGIPDNISFQEYINAV